MLLYLFSLTIAFAGEWRTPCQKVELASSVIEVEYVVKGRYAESLQKKGFPPSDKALKAISSTGRITHVFKGPHEVGEAWFGGPEFKAGGNSVSNWKRLFRLKSFRQIHFMIKRGDVWKSVGWAEESSACGLVRTEGPKDNHHRSWCGYYSEYKDQISRCAQWVQRPRIPLNRDMMQTVCSRSCGGRMASLSPYRNSQGSLVLLASRDMGHPDCKQAPKRLFDLDGETLLAEADLPEGVDRGKRYDALQRFIVSGLKLTKPLPCESAYLPPPPDKPPNPAVVQKKQSADPTKTASVSEKDKAPLSNALSAASIVEDRAKSKTKDGVLYSIATDALVWPLSGYSGIVMAESKKWSQLRITAEVFGISYPDSLLEQNVENLGEGWQRRVNAAVAIFADSHLESHPAFHYGLGLNAMQSSLGRLDYTEKSTLWTIEPLARIGYRIFPFGKEGLFINPYLAVGLPISLNTTEKIGAETFVDGAYQVIVTALIGWRFGALD